MTEREIEMIKELAEADGLSQSDIIRQLVRQAHAQRFGEKPTRKRSK